MGGQIYVVVVHTDGSDFSSPSEKMCETIEPRVLFQFLRTIFAFLIMVLQMLQDSILGRREKQGRAKLHLF